MARGKRAAKKTQDPPKKKGRSKKKPLPKQEEAVLEKPTVNDENAPPPRKPKVEKSTTRARRKQAVSYKEDSGTDPCDSESEPEATPLMVRSKTKAATNATKKQKEMAARASPSVRPPDGDSPRNIFGKKEAEPSPLDDWRVTSAQDW